MFCYDKLWKMLIDKHMNKVELRDAAGITSATLAKMGKNQNVSVSDFMSCHQIAHIS